MKRDYSDLTVTIHLWYDDAVLLFLRIDDIRDSDWSQRIREIVRSAIEDAEKKRADQDARLPR